MKETAIVRNAWARFCKSVETIISNKSNNRVTTESVPGENIEESCVQSTTSTDSGAAEHIETPIASTSTSVDEPVNK